MTNQQSRPPMKLAELYGLIEQETGVSRWIVVDQKRIDSFAETRGDRQFIHVDPVRAASSPYGTTIAHGLLTLSLMGEMKEVFPEISDLEMGVNYGYDKVRFLAPVRSGASIRARCKLADINEKSPNTWLCRYLVTIEILNSDQPAFVEDWFSECGASILLIREALEVAAVARLPVECLIPTERSDLPLQRQEHKLRYGCV